MNTPQRVVITAGGAGIGRALALAFQASGARVAVCDIDAGAITELVEIQPEILGRVANVTSAEEMSAFLGGVDAASAVLMWHWQMRAQVDLRVR